ncbi:MAG: cysteine synthase A [Erysipelotrichaceae bacterium]|nr:cysteine synthase A [Erysipelotrichaceae bacterium]MBR2791863.1 cysteine synthase A [Erysipelotrichaceae bacterium]MBR2825923.1 cysteine synthase A [Erysipelotrichaceae bacterium]MBR3350945.1 cysteine synthase A [Erysipelotrichaceae bacterium]MBR6957137.1 cysteine synthase A [Erysipelotrichaceae bacterium]
MLYKNVAELVGKTPLMELTGIEKAYELKGRVFAKLEYLNPTGSAKDRAALYMILDAEEKGILKKDSVIIEPTSGNTGIGLASIGVTRGYRVIIVMPASFSIERRKLIKAYGAEIVLSDASKGMAGAIEKANELAASFDNAFIPLQFDNQANARAHYETTGPEIWKDMEGRVDTFVAGIGTGGTITGVGHYLREQKPDVEIIAVEPASSPLLSEGKAGPHKIQGIGANFVPSILDTEVYDKVVAVSNDDAINTAVKLGHVEGILCGISSGAALCAAISAAKNEDKNVVVLLPDSGDRYLSTEMFSE